ncbi:MAG TPA: hypothetical protein VFA28_00710 [Bryobacteraceae bacterium]|nr:hypothetical protein [Bryobacteraceae bacterium]
MRITTCLVLSGIGVLCAIAQDIDNDDTPRVSKASPQQSRTLKMLARELLDEAFRAAPAASHSDIPVFALLHIGQNYLLFDSKKGTEILTQAFEAAQALDTESRREVQADVVDALVDVDLAHAIAMLRTLDAADVGEVDFRMRPTGNIVSALLKRGSVDEALDCLSVVGSQGEYPFRAAGLLFDQLTADDPRRLSLFSSAVSAFTARGRGAVSDFFLKRWRQVPRNLAESGVQALIDNALAETQKSEEGSQTTLTASKGAITLSSRQDAALFDIMYVLREVDAKRADALLEGRPALRAALAQFPQGRASMKGSDDEFVSVSTYVGPKQKMHTQDSTYSISESRAAQAAALLSKDADRALDVIRSIPDPSLRAQALASAVRAFSGSERADRLLSEALELVDKLQVPNQRIRVLSSVAEAAGSMKRLDVARAAIGRAMSEVETLYQRDTDRDRPNSALREYWPSTQAYRKLAWRAGALFGEDGLSLLAGIKDNDLALLAKIEFAQALLNRPATPGAVRLQYRQR